MGKRIVLALGGNALGDTPAEQKEAVAITARAIADLIENGDAVSVAHGNGPQVGMINKAFDAAAKSEVKTPEMPFPECGAMSQGYIGFHLQNAIDNELASRGIQESVPTIVTQVLVDESDPAFANPTKPIGSFMSEEEAKELAAKTGDVYKEDSGRGWRRVVPSPKPVDIIEKDTIKSLVDSGRTVISGGGGGVPVVRRNGKLEGVAAVIDKDFTSEKIAELIDADVFIILTAVEKVAIRFGQPDEQWLEKLSIEECEKYIADGEFGAGSMLPKVQACVQFAQSNPGRLAVITSLEKALEALEGKAGTRIQA